MNPNQLEVLRKNNESTRDFVRSCLRLALMVLLKGNDGEKINQLIWLSLSHSLMVYWLKEGRPETGEEMARLALKQTRGIPITFVS